jgi:hypothetical protein
MVPGYPARVTQTGMFRVLIAASCDLLFHDL